MYMNHDQYDKYKEKVLRSLINKESPNIFDYVSEDFTQDDFLDLIKDMENDGLISNVNIVPGGRGEQNDLADFNNALVTGKGRELIE